MVRKCIVPNCPNSDITILSHRFPTKEDLAFNWVHALNLDVSKYTKKDLKKYVVCTLHFDKRDYKNELSNKLNSTAIPIAQGYGHEPRKLLAKENCNSISSCEIAVLRNNNNEKQEKEINECSSINTIVFYNDLKIGNEEETLDLNKTPPNSSDVTSMETSIVECTEDDISATDVEYEDSDRQTMSEQYIIPNDELLMSQNSQIQHYESDVEIIDYNETLQHETEDNDEIEINIIHSELPKYEIYGNNSLSETVSLISSIAEADEEDLMIHGIDKTFADAACQSDPIEILLKESCNELEEDEYKNKSRKDLIELIKEQKNKIIEVDKKLREFQATHVKLVQSMDAFQILLTKDVEKNN